jgi:hypothetical protein
VTSLHEELEQSLAGFEFFDPPVESAILLLQVAGLGSVPARQPSIERRTSDTATRTDGRNRTARSGCVMAPGRGVCRGFLP